MFRLWPGGLFEGFLHPINISGVFSFYISPVSFPFAALLSHIYNYGDSKTLAINWLSKFKTKFPFLKLQTILKKNSFDISVRKTFKTVATGFFKLINHFVSCVQKRPLTFFVANVIGLTIVTICPSLFLTFSLIITLYHCLAKMFCRCENSSMATVAFKASSPSPFTS